MPPTTSPQFCCAFTSKSDVNYQRPISAFSKFTRPSNNSTVLSSTSNKNDLIFQVSSFEKPCIDNISNQEKNDFTNIVKNDFSESDEKRNAYLTPCSNTLDRQKEWNMNPTKTCINSRCVMLRYFMGNSEDKVDEHFSRALKKISAASKGRS